MDSISSIQYLTTPFQRWYYQRNTQQVYSVFTVGAKYVIKDDQGKAVKFNSAQFDNLLFSSLQSIIYNNLVLAVNVFNTGTEVRLLDEIEFDKVVIHHQIGEKDSTDDDDITNVIHKIQETPLLCTNMANIPLWRLHVVNNEWVFFACDHLFYDGMSGRNFHDELLNAIQQQIAQSAQISPISSISPIPSEHKLYSSSDLLERIKSNPDVYSQRLIPYPMEYHIKCEPTWVTLVGTIASVTLPSNITTIASNISKMIGLLPKGHQFSHTDGVDQWYTLKTVKQTAENDQTTEIVEKVITPVVFRHGEFDSHIKILRIPSETITFIKNKILKKNSNNISISIFLAYILSISILPITMNESIGITAPTNTRSIAMEGVKDISPSGKALLTQLHPESPLPSSETYNTNMKFGCIIGSWASKYKSFLNHFEKLQLWNENPPKTLANRVEFLKNLLMNEPSSVINFSLLETINDDFKSAMGNPTSNRGGLFYGPGQLQVANNFASLHDVVKGTASGTHVDNTLEVSNLGAVRFQTNGENDKGNGFVAGIADMLFSQPATWGSYLNFNVVGLLEPQPNVPQKEIDCGVYGGLNIVFTANAFYTKDEFNSMVDLAQCFFDNINKIDQ
jgi:hypothetical protein